MPVNINIIFYIKFANFWYITCFVPDSIPICPQSHGQMQHKNFFQAKGSLRNFASNVKRI